MSHLMTRKLQKMTYESRHLLTSKRVGTYVSPPSLRFGAPRATDKSGETPQRVLCTYVYVQLGPNYQNSSTVHSCNHITWHSWCTVKFGTATHDAGSGNGPPREWSNLVLYQCLN